MPALPFILRLQFQNSINFGYHSIMNAFLRIASSLSLVLSLLAQPGFANPPHRGTSSSSSQSHQTAQVKRNSQTQLNRQKQSNRRFIGYHGTSKAGFEVLSNRIHEFKSSAENQLGPGVYTTGHLETAQQFARLEGGKNGVVIRVFAHDFHKMSGTDPKVPWTRGAWTKPENQVHLQHQDFLWGEHKIFSPKLQMMVTQQIKFNPRAFQHLTFEHHSEDNSQ